jgi:hypothetical protein
MQFLKFLLACIILTGSGYASADHAAGGYFQYTCLGNGQYQVDFFFLRDCDGLDYPETVDFSIRNSCQTNCSDLTVTAPLFESSQVNYGCGTGCDSPDGFQLAQYRRLITLPYACADWTITVSIEARNSVSYTDYIGSADYFNYCIINNTNTICNNSVQVSGPPFAIGCTGNSGRSLYTLTSPVGNTLVYDFVTPKTGECAQSSDVNFHSGASTLRPFPSSSNFILAQDGTFTFLPTSQGDNYFAVRIREYANTILVGTTVIDGIIIARACSQGGMISFSDWANDDDNTYTVSGVGQDHCRTIILTPNEANGDVANVTVTGPYLSGYEVLHLPDGKAAVTICVQFPQEVMCPEVDALLIVTAQTASADCFNHVMGGGASTGYYHVVKQRGEYCPDNLYFTNRSPTGNPMPAYARAEERIWVGDDMPNTAPQIIQGNEGEVIAQGNIELVAGIEVILPSCQGGPNTGCVTISGNSTIWIDSLSCSSDCYHEPLLLSVKEEFNCYNERLIATSTGEAPFTYNWNVNGQLFTNTSGILNIHELVAAASGYEIPYTCTVQDAVGESAAASGQVWTTKRFYENIQNNTQYYDFPTGPLGNPSSIHGPPGNYYGGSIWVSTHHPAHLFDDVNSGPPWYGATRATMRVWSPNGEMVLDLNPNLEGGDDWSFDNGELFWNGHWYNDLGQNCVYLPPAGASVYVYTLEARNCANYVQYEAAAFGFGPGGEDYPYSEQYQPGCPENAWQPTQVKSGSIDGKLYPLEPDRYPDLKLAPLAFSSGIDDYCQLSPNPAGEIVEIRSNQKEFLSVQIMDQKGTVVMEFINLAANTPIHIETLSAGIYTVRIADQYLKLVKE